MEELIRKGSIVAKRFGILDIPKKYRHMVTFGCDCLLVDGIFHPLKEDASFIEIKYIRSKRIRIIFKDIKISHLFAV